MQVVEIDQTAYDALFATSNTGFHSAAFAELNKHRCDEVIRLVFVDGKEQAGLIIGRKGNSWFSPFSAPFGGFSIKQNHEPTIAQAEQIIESLVTYVETLHAESLHITFPPLFYNASFLTKIQHACIERQFQIKALDLDYYFETNRVTPTFPSDVFSRNAKRNLKVSTSYSLQFEQVFGAEGLRKAYAVIQENRKAKDYHLSMDFDALLATSALIQTDSFVLKLEGINIASAIVFHNSPAVVQVIYWGDLVEYNSVKPMFVLSSKLFEHYATKHIAMVDVGPSMLHNKPIHGLCDFKESIGCRIQPKLTLVWKKA